MTGDIIPRGEIVPTGHDWRTAEGQQALARLLLYGAQAGTAVRNVAEVMRRHGKVERYTPGGRPRTATCELCGEPWYWTARDGSEIEGCSTYLLADAIEAVLWVASNKPGPRP